MSLTNFMLGERNYKRPHNIQSHLYKIIGIGKSIKIKSRLVISNGWGVCKKVWSDC